MPDNTAYIYNRLIQGGLTPIGAQGLLGNWKAESGGNISPTAQNPGGAYGIAQWNDRKGALFDYTGTKTPNLDQQIDFALHELHGSEGASFKALNNATDIRSAVAAGAGYERPEGWTAANPYATNDFSRRLSYGQQTAGLLGSGNSTSGYAASSAVAPPQQQSSMINPQPSSPGPMTPTSAGTSQPNQPDAGLLGAMASGGQPPDKSPMQGGLDQIAAAFKPQQSNDPAPPVAQDPGVQMLQQKRQMAMQAAQKYLPTPSGFSGLLG